MNLRGIRIPASGFEGAFIRCFCTGRIRPIRAFRPAQSKHKAGSNNRVKYFRIFYLIIFGAEKSLEKYLQKETQKTRKNQKKPHTVPGKETENGNTIHNAAGMRTDRADV